MFSAFILGTGFSGAGIIGMGCMRYSQRLQEIQKLYDQKNQKYIREFDLDNKGRIYRFEKHDGYGMDSNIDEIADVDKNYECKIITKKSGFTFKISASYPNIFGLSNQTNIYEKKIDKVFIYGEINNNMKFYPYAMSDKKELLYKILIPNNKYALFLITGGILELIAGGCYLYF